MITINKIQDNQENVNNIVVSFLNKIQILYLVFLNKVIHKYSLF